MAIDVKHFKGEAPRIAPRLLPDDMAQNSANARLISGSLESWKGFYQPSAQALVTGSWTIYYMNDQLWLSWARPVVTV